MKSLTAIPMLTQALLTSPVDVSGADFPEIVLDSEVPVIVDFWAPSCGPCRMLAPVLESVAMELAGEVVVAKVNVDENPSLATRYGIRSVPSMGFFDCGRLVDGLVGIVSKGAIIRKVRSLG